MGRSFGFLTLIVVVGAGAYVYTKQMQVVKTVGATAETLVDSVGVRNDLMAIAVAEKRYWVSHGKYAPIDELRINGDIHIPTRPNYTYSAETSDTGFRVIASYTGGDGKTPKHITVNEAMAM